MSYRGWLVCGPMLATPDTPEVGPLLLSSDGVDEHRGGLVSEGLPNLPRGMCAKGGLNLAGAGNKGINLETQVS